MKIYTVYDGKVESLKVAETPEMFFASERKPAFENRLCFHKTEYATTPQEAIKEAREKTYKAIEVIIQAFNVLTEKLETEKRNLEALNLLAEEYKE